MDKKKILLIDDEVDFTKVARLKLEQTGRYEVRTENNGTSGIAAAKAFKPDLILLDIMMPGIDGGDVAYKLKYDLCTKDIPIVFLTALVNQKEAGQRNSGHAYLSKPASKEEIIDCIEKNIK